ncbi:MAG: hypothetical protein ABIO71_13545 [Caldimonas sp.]
MAASLSACCLLAACSPALDWREVRPEGSGVTLLLPCRPLQLDRVVRLGEASLPMRLHSCTASEATFSIVFADAGTAALADALLPAMRGAAIANVAGAAMPLPLPAIDGATPSAQSGLLRIVGRLPDGRPVVEHAAFFVRGSWLYQAAVVSAGEPVGPQAIEDFFRAIRVR